MIKLLSHVCLISILSASYSYGMEKPEELKGPPRTNPVPLLRNRGNTFGQLPITPPKSPQPIHALLLKHPESPSTSGSMSPPPAKSSSQTQSLSPKSLGSPQTSRIQLSSPGKSSMRIQPLPPSTEESPKISRLLSPPPTKFSVQTPAQSPSPLKSSLRIQPKSSSIIESPQTSRPLLPPPADSIAQTQSQPTKSSLPPLMQRPLSPTPLVPKKPLPAIPPVKNQGLSKSSSLSFITMRDHHKEEKSLTSEKDSQGKSLIEEKRVLNGTVHEKKNQADDPKDKNTLRNKWASLEDVSLDEAGKKKKIDALMKISADLAVFERSLKVFESEVVVFKEEEEKTSAQKIKDKVKKVGENFQEFKHSFRDFFKEDKETFLTVSEFNPKTDVKNSNDLDPRECAKALPNQYITLADKICSLQSKIEEIQDVKKQEDFKKVFIQLRQQFMDITSTYYKSITSIYAKQNELKTAHSSTLSQEQAKAKEKLEALEKQKKIKEQENKNEKLKNSKIKIKSLFEPGKSQDNKVTEKELTEKEINLLKMKEKEKIGIAVRLRGRSSSLRDVKQENGSLQIPRTLTPTLTKKSEAPKKDPNTNEDLSISKPEGSPGARPGTLRESRIRDTRSSIGEQELRRAIAFSLLEALINAEYTGSEKSIIGAIEDFFDPPESPENKPSEKKE